MGRRPTEENMEILNESMGRRSLSPIGAWVLLQSQPPLEHRVPLIWNTSPPGGQPGSGRRMQRPQIVRYCGVIRTSVVTKTIWVGRATTLGSTARSALCTDKAIEGIQVIGKYPELLSLAQTIITVTTQIRVASPDWCSFATVIT
ncbi:hypothetical protein J6590_052986 [Homalodisca vitripennis]|nr:hypothetical protein J6590_052986 [Homalodisca vitripennis]